jgi:hypothetical protein
MSINICLVTQTWKTKLYEIQHASTTNKNKKNQTLLSLVRERTIPTVQPPLVDEI